MIVPIITLDLFATAKRVDICDYLWSKKDIRLYFCPKQFPAPLDKDKAWEVDSFKRLRWFIRQSSIQGDSPVVYNGSNKSNTTARFRCTQCKGGNERCPFSFIVRADQYGYYIYHYNHEEDTYVGWRYHEH
jgi:hypothetical protein